jgi:hypothetical protein
MLSLPVEYTQPTSSTLVDGAKFGSSVSLNADTLVVGAPEQNGLQLTSVDTQVQPYTWTSTEVAKVGFAYFYSIATDGSTTLSNKFTSADSFGDLTVARESGEYGFSVSAGNGIVIVGEPKASRNAFGNDLKTNAGLAHIYVMGETEYELSKTVEGFYVDRNPFKVINTLFDDFEKYAIENNVDIIQVTSHPGDSRNTLIRVLKRKGYETLGYVAKKDLRRGRSFRINR